MRNKTPECPFTECSKHSNCIIIEITKKVPKSFDSCSYSETKELSQKRAVRAAKAAEAAVKPKRKRRATKESEDT